MLENCSIFELYQAEHICWLKRHLQLEQLGDVTPHTSTPKSCREHVWWGMSANSWEHLTLSTGPLSISFPNPLCILCPFVSLPLAILSYGTRLCSCYNMSLLFASPLLPDSFVQTNYLQRDPASHHETLIDMLFTCGGLNASSSCCCCCLLLFFILVLLKNVLLFWCLNDVLLEN